METMSRLPAALADRPSVPRAAPEFVALGGAETKNSWQPGWRLTRYF